MNLEFFLFVCTVNCEIPSGTPFIQFRGVIFIVFKIGSSLLGAFQNISAQHTEACHCLGCAVILCLHPAFRSALLQMCQFSEILYKSCVCFSTYACELICLGEGLRGQRRVEIEPGDAEGRFVIRSLQLMVLLSTGAGASHRFQFRI